MIPRVLLSVVVSPVIGSPAFAAVTSEEAKQLGASLTEFGSIKAGSEDGSIPEYQGNGVHVWRLISNTTPIPVIRGRDVL